MNSKYRILKSFIFAIFFFSLLLQISFISAGYGINNPLLPTIKSPITISSSGGGNTTNYNNITNIYTNITQQINITNNITTTINTQNNITNNITIYQNTSEIDPFFTAWNSTFFYNYNQTTPAITDLNNSYNKWWYNMTTPFQNWLNGFQYNYNQSSIFSYNHSSWIESIYGKWFYNMTTPAQLYSDNNLTAYTYTKAQSDANYSEKKWNYNQTYTGGTYNSTYDTWAYNMTQSSGNSSFNQSLTNSIYSLNATRNQNDIYKSANGVGTLASWDGVSTWSMDANSIVMSVIDNAIGKKAIDLAHGGLYDSAGLGLMFDWFYLKFPSLTSNGFLKTSNSDGSIIVDTANYLNDSMTNNTIASEGNRIGFNSTYNATYATYAYNQTTPAITDLNNSYNKWWYNMTQSSAQTNIFDQQLNTTSTVNFTSVITQNTIRNDTGTYFDTGNTYIIHNSSTLILKVT